MEMSRTVEPLPELPDDTLLPEGSDDLLDADDLEDTDEPEGSDEFEEADEALEPDETELPDGSLLLLLPDEPDDLLLPEDPELPLLRELGDELLIDEPDASDDEDRLLADETLDPLGTLLGLGPDEVLLPLG